MSEKPTGPIASAVVDGKTTVFYVNSLQFLKSLTNPAAGDKEELESEDRSRDNYRDTTVEVDNVHVRSDTKYIAAISYNLPNDGPNAPTRSRIYYIHPGGYLAELCNDEGRWCKGELDTKQFPAVPDSPITATWSSGSHSIKVVYYSPKKDTKAPFIAWNAGREKGGWQTSGILRDL